MTGPLAAVGRLTLRISASSYTRLRWARGLIARGLIGPTLAAFAAVGVLVCVVFAFLLDGMSSMKSNADRARRARARRAAHLAPATGSPWTSRPACAAGLLTGDDQYPQTVPRRRAADPARSRRSCVALVEDPAQRRALRAAARSASRATAPAGRRWPPALPLDAPARDLRAQLGNGKEQLDALRARFDAFRDRGARAVRSPSGRRRPSARPTAPRSSASPASSLTLAGLVALAVFTVRWIRREAEAAIGARPRRGGVADQVHVPGQHEPRDPHAAQRRHRDVGAAAGHRARPRAARVRDDRARLGRAAAGGHQRHLGHLEDRGRPPRARGARLRPARGGRDDLGRRRRDRARQGPGAVGLPRRRRPARGARRPRPASRRS